MAFYTFQFKVLFLFSFLMFVCFSNGKPILLLDNITWNSSLKFLESQWVSVPAGFWPLMVTPPSRKVMVVADPTPHSAAALQYALSHALLEKDKLILLHIENPNSWKNTFSTFLRRPSLSSAAAPAPSSIPEGASADMDFLDQMKRTCEIAQPKISVSIEKLDLDGKDKATMILSKNKALGIDLIIIGQKRSFSSAILGYKRPSGSMKGSKLIDTADYLIENSQCTCVAVQKKGQNGGYVLNSKSHKNFWLLA